MSTMFRSKKEVVYEYLHEAIVKGDYKAGERVVIDELAANLGVSQIPIREALRQLESDGFVTIEPYVGATVTEFNANFVFEIFTLLETMEAICGRAACRCMNEEELQRLDDLVQQMDECLDEPNKWSKLNKEFHLLICEFARTGLIKEMMRKALDHWDRLRMYYLKDVLGLRLEMAQVEHRQIIDAFHDRNEDEVEHLIRAHNQNALAAYDNYFQAAGFINEEENNC